MQRAKISSPFAIWDWNLVDKQLTSTPELDQLYGLEPGTLQTYEDWSARIHPDDLHRIEAERQQAIAEHRPIKQEFRVLHPSGEIHWILSRGNAVYDTAGVPTRVLEFNSDITEQKNCQQVEEKPAATSAGSVLSNADAIITTDAEGRITTCTEAAERLFGYAKAELIGAALDVLIPARLRAIYRENLARFNSALDPGRHMSAACVGLRKNSEEFLFEVSLSSKEGGGHSLTLRDSAKQQHIDEQQRFLAEAAEELAATLDYEQTLMCIAKLAVREFADFCMVDVVEDSLKATRMVAHRDPSDALLAETLDQFVLDRRRPRLGSSVLETRQPLILSEIKPEYLRSIAKDDEHISVLEAIGPKSLIVLPLLAHGRVLGDMVLVSNSASRQYTAADLSWAEDLGHRAALALHSARLYRTAQRAVAARDDVLGIVAHDLRNPLNTILLQSQLLLSLGSGPIHHRADIIHRSVRRMSRLIQDLLDVARIDVGCLKIDRGSVDAEQVICECLEMQKPLANECHVELRQDVVLQLPKVWADRDRLLQVFENLVGNAIKFTPPGGTITLGANQAENAVRFWVTDTGEGIASAHLNHLFDRFWQGGRAEHRGIGLGLFIVKSIIEAQGGGIWVESSLGHGTTFFFTLPLVFERKEQLHDQRAPQVKDRELQIRILVVDDEHATLSALKDILLSAGFVVETARNGAEALSRLATFVPDILLTDMQMSGLDGISLAEQVRLRRPEILVILMTWVDPAAAALLARFERAGAHYVAKPIEVKALLDTIHRALREGPARIAGR